MPNSGDSLLCSDGKRGLNASGQVLLHRRLGSELCAEFTTCCRKPDIVAEKITNAGDETRRCWDLTGLQGDCVGCPGGRWRLIEVGDPPGSSCYTGNPPGNYGEGEIDENGRLVGLPDEFCSIYSYDGHMELQTSCSPSGTPPVWPGPCSAAITAQVPAKI